MNKWRAYFKQNRRAFTPVKSGKHYLTGFTLVELLVVVAIIGILATVVVISYSGAQKKARDARRQSDMSTIEQALNLYYNDLGSYPVHLAGTGPMFCATTVDASTTGLADTLRNSLSSYLPTFPTDPSNPGAGTAAGYAETVHSYFYCQKWVGTNPPTIGVYSTSTYGLWTSMEVLASNTTTGIWPVNSSSYRSPNWNYVLSNFTDNCSGSTCN